MDNVKGIVVGRENGYYVVRVMDPADKCKDCALAAICRASRSNTVLAVSETELKKGETVELYYPEIALIFAYAIIFLLPILFLIVVLGITGSALWAGIATLLSFVVLKLSDRWLAEHITRPRIVRIE